MRACNAALGGARWTAHKQRSLARAGGLGWALPTRARCVTGARGRAPPPRKAHGTEPSPTTRGANIRRQGGLRTSTAKATLPRPFHTPRDASQHSPPNASYHPCGARARSPRALRDTASPAVARPASLASRQSLHCLRFSCELLSRPFHFQLKGGIGGSFTQYVLLEYRGSRQGC